MICLMTFLPLIAAAAVTGTNRTWWCVTGWCVCVCAFRTLLSLPWYRGQIDGSQEVMIGYSDSAKDAGRMAAAWAQYNAQVGIKK